jgi:hypothetical protein
MPLRSTELLFVDDQTVTCPHCSRQRPVTSEFCPSCGGRDVLLLDSLSPYSANFHLSSLLMLTTLIAVCFAVARIRLEAGIAMFVITGLATLRTGLLISERKRHRYPVSSRDVRRLFGMSVGGIILALFVLGVTLGFGGLMLGTFFAALELNSPAAALSLFILVVILSLALAIRLVRRPAPSYRPLLTGVGLAWGSGLLVLVVATTPRNTDAAGFVMLWVFIAATATAVHYASRRGGTPRAKSFVVGFSIGLCTLAAVAALASRNRVVEDVALFFGMSGIYLWPVLLTIMTLETIWSWDDAFPNITRRAERVGDAALPQTPVATDIADEEGIKFLGNAGDDAESEVK